MQVPYILTISHSFPQQGKPSYSTLQASQKEKKVYLKAFFMLIKGYFFQPFCLFCCNLKAIRYFIYLLV